MKQVVLLVNTGSPHSASEQDVRKYLHEFLTDRDIIHLPSLIRHLLVRTIVVPYRVNYSTGRYRQLVSMYDGVMPLTAEMQRLAKLVEQLSGIQTLYAPRYAQSRRTQWGERIADLAQTDDVEVLLLPLYPQFTRSNAGRAISYFKDLPKPSGGHYKTSVLSHWGSRSSYIHLLAKQIERYVDPNDSSYHYIASYHSIPQSHYKYDVDHGWDYESQCLDTLQAVMAVCGIPEERYHIAFHSSIGHTKWSQPTLSNVLQGLAQQGIHKIALFSPSFIVECLETKIDLELEARDEFLTSGGETFVYIPCIGEHPECANLITELLQAEL